MRTAHCDDGRQIYTAVDVTTIPRVYSRDGNHDNFRVVGYYG